MKDKLVSSVLHPTDFSEASHVAFAQALAIALLGDTTFTILHVGPEGANDVRWSNFPQVRQTLNRWGLLEPGSPEGAVLDKFDMRVRKVSVRGRTPVHATLKYLDKEPADLIVLATGGRTGVTRVAHRSDAEAIARSSKTMTLFVSPRARRGVVSPEDGSGSLRNILVPVDATPDSGNAIGMAQRTARMLGDPPVDITLLHVGETFPIMPTPADDPGWTWQRETQTGAPVEQILAAARRRHADLIVMATSGHEGVLDALRGSTTEQVLRQADCPVLAVPVGF